MNPIGSRTLASETTAIEAEFGRVLGLDLSLASTGISDTHDTDAIQVGPGIRGEARLNAIVRAIQAWVPAVGSLPPVGLAVIEGPAFSRGGQSGHDELAGLRWVVRHALWRSGIPLAIVPPTALKRATTGSGSAPKELMRAAVLARHGVDFSDVKVGRGRYDMVDAYALSVMGHRYLAGEPWAAVDWPDVRSLSSGGYPCGQ